MPLISAASLVLLARTKRFRRYVHVLIPMLGAREVRGDLDAPLELRIGLASGPVVGGLIGGSGSCSTSGVTT